jgi:signal transduction histidine kinase
MPELIKKFNSSVTDKLRGSFRVKLFAGITALILLVSAGFATLLFYQQYNAQRDKRSSEGVLIARLLARDVRLAVFSGGRDELLRAAQGIMAFPDIQAVEIYDRAGLLIGRLAHTADEHVKYSVFTSMIPGLLNRQLEEPLLVGKSWGGDPEAAIGSVKVFIDDSKYEAKLVKLIIIAVTSTLLFLAFGILAAFRLAESMTRPLRQLSACAAALKAGDETVCAPIETSDEIGELAALFNSMVEAIRRRTKDLETALEELYQLNIVLEDKVEKRTFQLESANRELESFNYSASHDLRAPLNRLAGFCDALKEEYGDRLDEQGLHYLQRIAATGEQMNSVLSAMLTLYQIQQRAMTPRSLDISELVRAVAASLRQREPEREVTFVIQDNILVYGDMKLIWLALENLLGNAWKFTRCRADAQIEFGQIEQEGESVCFIRDNGAGFNMEYADKLFTPFQRLHNNDDFPGTGVGLAIVQRIISRQNGRIWLESEEGKGTVCYFVLPPGYPDVSKGEEGGSHA